LPPAFGELRREIDGGVYMTSLSTLDAWPLSHPRLVLSYQILD
jgi:hypothetical protein